MSVRRRWTLLSLLALALLAGVIYGIHLQVLQSRMLRGDPQAVAETPALMAFAEPRGRRVFEKHCAVCHGAQGHGDSARGVPNLADNDWLYGDGHMSDIEQVVNFGIRAHAPRTWNLADMPAYATPVPSVADKVPPLTPRDIADVTEMIIFMGGGKADPDAAARGSRIFADRGGCYDCHATDGHGDPGIGAPNLADNIWLYGDGSRASIARSIARGHHGICPAWVSRLKPAAIREVALYLHALSKSPTTPNTSTDKHS